MRDFVRKLKKEIEAEIHRIEAMDANNLKKSLEASHMLGAAFSQMKDFIIKYNFPDEAEEIYFFKYVKPRLCAHLIYYRKIYNIEMNLPVGSIEAQQAYLHHELDRIYDFQQKRQDFYRYLRSGATNLDSIYFLRGKNDMELYLESFHYERDPLFSTNCDFKVARIMANEMLQGFLQTKLETLSIKSTNPNWGQLGNVGNGIRWTDSKTSLVELIYALFATGVFNNGQCEIRELAVLFEQAFNVRLNDIYRTYLEIKIRTNPTKFLDTLKLALIRKIEEDF